MGKQQDLILEISRFGSMNSFVDPTAIEDNQLQYIVNFRYRANQLKARPPHKRVMTNTTTGIYPSVGGGTFRTTNTTYKVFGTSNGKLWYQGADSGTPTELTLSAGNALTAGNRISISQYLSKLYIVDGVNLLEWDGSSSSVTSRTAKLPIDITAPAYLTTWLTRLVVADRDGRIAISKQETSFASDPTPFDTTAGGFSVPVAKGDGLIITGIANGERILAISKQLARDKVTNLNTIAGTSSSNFELREASPSTGFLGDSAVQIGSDIFGLTPSGFRFLSTVQQLGEATQTAQNVTGASFNNRNVPDYLSDFLDEINYSNAHLITAIYNDIEQAYYCSFPYGEFASKNNLVIRVDFTNNDIRFSLYTDTFAQTFFKLNGYIYFLDHKCQIWKMNDETQSSYEEQEYHKLLASKAYDFQQISTSKVCQSITPEFKTYKNNKTFNTYFKAWRVPENGNATQLETNLSGTDISNATFKVKEFQSQLPSKLDFYLMDIGTMDFTLNRTAYKELTVMQNAEKIQLISSNQIQDIDGKERIDLRSLKFQGKVIAESKK